MVYKYAYNLIYVIFFSTSNSPGNSAKFCTYTLLDIDSGTIVHMETVDKWEVSLHSPVMEREAVSPAIKHLHENDIKINKIDTDAFICC